MQENILAVSKHQHFLHRKGDMLNRLHMALIFSIDIQLLTRCLYTFHTLRLNNRFLCFSFTKERCFKQINRVYLLLLLFSVFVCLCIVSFTLSVVITIEGLKIITVQRVQIQVRLILGHLSFIHNSRFIYQVVTHSLIRNINHFRYSVSLPRCLLSRLQL